MLLAGEVVVAAAEAVGPLRGDEDVAVAVGLLGQLRDDELGGQARTRQREHHRVRAAVVVLGRQPQQVLDAAGGRRLRAGVEPHDSGDATALGRGDRRPSRRLQVHRPRRRHQADDLRQLVGRQRHGGRPAVGVERRHAGVGGRAGQVIDGELAQVPGADRPLDRLVRAVLALQPAAHGVGEQRVRRLAGRLALVAPRLGLPGEVVEEFEPAGRVGVQLAQHRRGRLQQRRRGGRQLGAGREDRGRHPGGRRAVHDRAHAALALDHRAQQVAGALELRLHGVNARAGGGEAVLVAGVAGGRVEAGEEPARLLVAAALHRRLDLIDDDARLSLVDLVGEGVEALGDFRLPGAGRVLLEEREFGAGGPQPQHLPAGAVEGGHVLEEARDE